MIGTTSRGVCKTCNPHMAQPPTLCSHACKAPAADSDVAFVNKPIWESYLAFVEEVGADAAFQTEDTGGLQGCCGRGAVFRCHVQARWLK